MALAHADAIVVLRAYSHVAYVFVWTACTLDSRCRIRPQRQRSATTAFTKIAAPLERFHGV
jgi:hypothetical protein